MKVAYLNCLLAKQGRLGVEKKLGEQAKAVTLMDLDIDICYFNFRRELKDTGIYFYRRSLGFPNELVSVLNRYTCISEHIDSDKYDVLVLRYSGGDFSCFTRFFRDNAKRIITEHHTKELPEAHTYNTTLPQKAVTLFMEKFIGPRMISRCAGLIANSDEIRAYELKRIGTSIPACTITDGVSVGDTPFSRHAPYTGKTLNLLCLAASFEPWQGLDRVLAGLGNYASKNPTLRLRIVGDVSPRYRNLADRLNQNREVEVEFVGKVFGRKLEEVFEDSHIAFSPLAMFRKRIDEGCALKTREYVSRGLPFVIGHRDPDLKDAEEFFLSIRPDDSPVDMEQVVTFAERILTKKGLCRYMREYAEDRLDWKIKIQQMWDFLKTIKN